MADVDIGAAIARLDARIDKLRAERRVMLKLHRSNGAALSRRPRSDHQANGTVKGGTKQAILLRIVQVARPNGVSTEGAFNSVSQHTETTLASVRAMLSILRRKGMIRRLDNGMWMAARQRAA